MSAPYPASSKARAQWVLQHRGPKNPVRPDQPYAFLWEEEIGPAGDLVSTATIFLTNKECPYRCLMCDLWQNTLDEQVPPGAIPSQIRYALDRLPPARQVKLYNSGNFFDSQAIPPEDYPAIAALVSGFERVIVECHPAMLGQRCLGFQEMIPGKLEVAAGLETANPLVLEQLNKRLTLDAFYGTGEFLSTHGIDLRVFLLLNPPFLDAAAGLEWTLRSLDTAFDCGATACSVIPTRSGNGAMEALAQAGAFTPPSLAALEAAQEYGLSLGRGRVFSDLWDVERFYSCACAPLRAERLGLMNRTQEIPAPVVCDTCRPS